jgi:hypothetical protein
MREMGDKVCEREREREALGTSLVRRRFLPFLHGCRKRQKNEAASNRRNVHTTTGSWPPLCAPTNCAIRRAHEIRRRRRMVLTEEASSR